jgi:hypothetical protein
LYVQDEYVQGYQAHPQQTQALPSPRSFHKHPHVTLPIELALIVQPSTVRDEQLLETSGKILDHIVSLACLIFPFKPVTSHRLIDSCSYNELRVPKAMIFSVSYTFAYAMDKVLSCMMSSPQSSVDLQDSIESGSHQWMAPR